MDKVSALLSLKLYEHTPLKHTTPSVEVDIGTFTLSFQYFLKVTMWEEYVTKEDDWMMLVVQAGLVSWVSTRLTTYRFKK